MYIYMEVCVPMMGFCTTVRKEKSRITYIHTYIHTFVFTSSDSRLLPAPTNHITIPQSSPPLTQPPTMGPLDVATSIIGLALLGSGFYGVFYPLEMARIFGIISVSREMVVFYPGIGGRNVSAGLTVWAFKFMRLRRALGVFLLCWTVVGYADTYLMLVHYGEVELVWLHVFNICLLTVVAGFLIGGGKGR